MTQIASPPAVSAPSPPVTSPVVPATFVGTWADAWEHARAEAEPIFVPAAPHVDDRGWSLMNLLRGVMSRHGQINVSTMLPDAVKAWHRHERQTDFWMCVQGHLKVGVHRESDGRSWLLVTGEQRPGVVIIPPGLWHGGTALGPAPATLLYYVSHAYDAKNPDEQRRPHDSVPGFPWGIRHG